METPIRARVRWPSPDGDLEVTLHFARVDGRVECIGVDVRTFRWKGEPHPARRLPRTEPRPITTTDLRGLRLAEIIEVERAKLARFLFADSGDEDWDATPWAAGVVEAWEPKARGRPRIYGPEHFAEVARVYREADARSRTPTRAVARHFGVSQAAAAKWVARCRELGLLPPTTRGKARGVAPREGRRNR